MTREQLARACPYRAGDGSAWYWTARFDAGTQAVFHAIPLGVFDRIALPAWDSGVVFYKDARSYQDALDALRQAAYDAMMEARQ